MELKPGYKETEVGVIPEDWEVKNSAPLLTSLWDQSTGSKATNSDSRMKGSIPILR